MGTVEPQLVDAAEVREGDLIRFLGQPHLVTRIEPYVHPLFPDEEWGNAVEEPGGWRITLIPGNQIEVLRR